MPSVDKPRVLIVIAHPDDFAHSMGGTAWLLNERYHLHVVCLTTGQRGIKGVSMDEAGRIRRAEEQACADLLGAELTFADQIDGEVFADAAVCGRVADILRRDRPVALFTLWPLNIPDHVMAYAIAIKALGLSGLSDQIEVYMTENCIGGQTNQFEPDLYVDISDVIEEKKRLVQCHLSQNPTEGSVQRVLERNRIRGMMARCDYAEPFRTALTINNRRWGRRAGSLLLDL